MMIHKYIYGAVTLVVIGLVMAILWLKADASALRSDIIIAQQQRDTALAENTRQATAIERLHRLDAQKDALLADIANQLSAIHADVQETGQSLKELETTNETVRDFLNLALPDDLQRLLNKR